ncbi:MAG: putative chromosome segregation ATPase [Chitinophagaceae bacterium]|nr:putative chromosome segregation ATPase [Chitinophagaceae bacterium]
MTTEEKKDNKKGLIIILILLLIGTNGIWGFVTLKQQHHLEESTTKVTEQTVKIDSLNKEFELKIQQLDSMKTTILNLGGDTTRIGEEIRQLRTDLAKASRDARKYKALYSDLQRDFDIKLNKYVKRIDELQAFLNQADSLNKEKDKTINQKDIAISTLNNEKVVLQEKVTLASVLRADKFSIEALDAKGKARPGDDVKAKKVDKLKIGFVLEENKVADVKDREVIMRLIEPDGAALYETSTGGGEFTFDNKQLYYTLKTNVLYDKTAKKLTFEYKKGSAYKVGTYTVQIYCEDALIGETTFKVR